MIESARSPLASARLWHGVAGPLVTHHDARVLGAADDRGEDGARRVVAGEAGLDHAAAVVDHERLVAGLRLGGGLRGKG